jgi:hypothetical protein
MSIDSCSRHAHQSRERRDNFCFNQTLTSKQTLDRDPLFPQPSPPALPCATLPGDELLDRAHGVQAAGRAHGVQAAGRGEGKKRGHDKEAREGASRRTDVPKLATGCRRPFSLRPLSSCLRSPSKPTVTCPSPTPPPHAHAHNQLLSITSLAAARYPCTTCAQGEVGACVLGRSQSRVCSIGESGKHRQTWLGP